VIDLALPPEGGIAALERLHRRARPPTIVWSFDPSAEDVLSAISAGAVGYLTKEVSADDLIASVRSALAGEAVLSTHLTGLLVAAVQRDRGAQLARESLLSARERRVLELVSNGLRNRDIAAELGISEFTVKRHVQNILRKLELPSRRAAAARHSAVSRGAAA
jgi:two-component system nitrate/nitrite response regulator NarL